MKSIKLYYSITALIIVIMAVGCERKLDELQLATKYPTNPDVFIDGLNLGPNPYNAWGKVTNFSIDYVEKYSGTASMKFDVPNLGDPLGNAAGGAFFTPVGRDLSGYTALTFWAKASEVDTLTKVGFGSSAANGVTDETYKVTVNNLVLTTTWTKYYIPIPDPSKLTNEKGMFWYWVDPRNGGKGFTYWIDELKFENLGTIAYPSSAVFPGKDMNVETDDYQIPDLSATFNLPTGINQTETFTSANLTLASTNPGVATVNKPGKFTVVNAGSTLITAKLVGNNLQGAALITSLGAPTLPTTALTPDTTTYPPANVKSIYSDSYTNATIDSYEPFWIWSGGGMTTAYSIKSVVGNNYIRYTNLNDTYNQKGILVAISFETVPVDISAMTTFHMDVFVQATSPHKENKPIIRLEDWSQNYGGTNSIGSYTSSTELATGSWVPLDIPLSSFTGLSGKSHLVHIVLENFPSIICVDNIYFHK